MVSKITKSAVDRLKFDKAGSTQQILWDTHLKGFGVRVYETGKKSFVVGYSLSGRWRVMAIGAVGVLTVDQARTKAQLLLAGTIEGRDPLEQRQKERGEVTVSEFTETYLERHARARKKTWKEDERLIKSHIVSRWRLRKLSSITRAEIGRLHYEVGKIGPFEANRALACISKMFSCAIDWGFLGDSTVNPARGVKKFPELRRSRYLTKKEIARLAKAVSEETNIYVRGFFMLALLTGLRKSELLRARWDQLDPEGGFLHLKETKNGRPFDVPLSRHALQIFKELPRQMANPHIFPSTVLPGQPIQALNKNWNRIRKSAGLKDVRVHDLRRTFGSMMAQSGVGIQVVGRALNQRSIDVTASTYSHLSDKQIRNAVDSLNDEILSAVESGR